MEVSGDGAAGLDLIRISGIRHYGYTGFFAEEQVLGQWFEVNQPLAGSGHHWRQRPAGEHA
jgi:hypothetical protein